MALPAGMSSCAMCVQFMTGTTTTWSTTSSNMSVVDPPTATRMSGEAYVFGEPIALVTYGKREPLDVTVRGIWAEGTADPFYNIYLAWTTACGGTTAVRWAPAGCTTAHDAFSTSTTASRVTALTFPAGDAGDGSPIMYEFTVHTPEVTRATWA